MSKSGFAENEALRLNEVTLNLVTRGVPFAHGVVEYAAISLGRRAFGTRLPASSKWLANTMQSWSVSVKI
jgi:hypothetical protein